MSNTGGGGRLRRPRRRRRGGAGASFARGIQKPRRTPTGAPRRPTRRGRRSTSLREFTAQGGSLTTFRSRVRKLKEQLRGTSPNSAKARTGIERVASRLGVSANVVRRAVFSPVQRRTADTAFGRELPNQRRRRPKDRSPLR